MKLLGLSKVMGILLILLLQTSYAFGQDSCFISKENNPVTAHQFDDGKYKAATKDLDYSRDVMPEEKKRWKGFSPKGFDINPDIAKVIFFALIIGLLSFILIKLIGTRRPGGEKVSDADPLTSAGDEIENIHETDLQKLLSDALKEGNLRRAVRFYYLIVIRELSLQNLINWKKEKTNFAYITEMMNHSLSGDFNKATYAFEKTWYGDIHLNENEFRQIQSFYDHLLVGIRNINSIPG